MTHPLPPLVRGFTWAAVLSYLLLSGSLLDSNGWPYSLAGGGIFFKVHPGTYCVLAAFGLFLAQGNPVRVAVRMAMETPVHAGFLVLVLALTAYVLARFGSSGAAFLLDLHIAPVLLAILLSRFTPDQLARLLLAVLSCLVLDATIGLAEYALRVRITPYIVDGKPVREFYFRSTALMGHPLQNALAIATGLMILPVLRRHRMASIAAGLLMTASLIPFGGRSALFISVGLALVWAPFGLARGMKGVAFGYRRLVGVLLGAGVLLGTLAAGLVVFGTNTRVFSGFRWDASANTRLLGLRILDTVSPFELLFGIGPIELRRRTEILANYHGILGLENSWLLLLLIFGGIGVALFAGGLLTWLWAMLRGAPIAAWFAAVAFLAVASTNNTLASKDTTLVLLVMLIYGARGYAVARVADPGPAFPVGPRSAMGVPAA